ncbi:MAG: hypothetical protein ABIJ23_03930 [Candidatus Magasanikbacteria bacterium]
MVAERYKNFEEKFPDFNIKNLSIGDQVSVYVNGAWRSETLNASPRIDHGMIIMEVAGGARLVETAVPPKKIELPVADPRGGSNTVEIDGRTYTYDRNNFRIDENGDAIYNLADTTGRGGKERLGIKAEILRNLSEAKGIHKEVRDLLTKIEAVVSIRRKDLLSEHTKLTKRVEKLLLSFGSPADWEDWDAKEVEDVGKRLESTRQQVSLEVAELEKAMKEIEQWQTNIDGTNKRAELGTLEAERLEDAQQREIKKRERAENADYKTRHTGWESGKEKWDEYQAGGKKKNDRDTAWNVAHPGEPIPTSPGKEPVKKVIDQAEAIDQADWAYFNGLKKTNEVYKEVVERRREKASKLKIGRDYPAGSFAGTATPEEQVQAEEFRDVSIKIMKEVIAQWKEEETEKFDFAEEKKSLEDKVVELRAEIAKYPPAKPLEGRVKTVHDSLLTIRKEDPSARDNFLSHWKELGEIELEVYKEEIAATSKPELAERDIDISQDLLMRIFASREAGVNNLMQNIYSLSLNEGGVVAKEAIRSSLKGLFRAEPDRALLLELQRSGIKSWDNFQKLLDGQLGDNLTRVLNVMAQEHLKKEVAKNTSWLDKTKAIKWQIGSRMLSTLACVGGGTFLATSLFATGGLAGVGLVAAGGATGGFARGLLNKFAFGHKKVKEHTAQKMKELEERKKQEFIAQMLGQSFGNNSAGDSNFEQRTNAEFSSIMAQCLREVSKAEVSATEPDDAKKLGDNAKRIYIESIRNLEMSGTEVGVEQREKFALALLQMQAKTQELAQKAGEQVGSGRLKQFMSDLVGQGSDPVLIKLLSGSMKVYSGNMENTTAALTFSTLSGAGLSMAMASGNPWARSAMGAIGGGLAGYQFGEGRRLRKGEEIGRTELDADFESVNNFFGQHRAGLANPAHRLRPEEMREFSSLIIKLKSALKNSEQEVKAGTTFFSGRDKYDAKQWSALALQGDPVFRKQIENLVYEAEKAGILVEQERREDLGAALRRLDEHKQEVLNQCESKIGSRVKKWLGRNLERTAWTVGGAVAGGAFTWLVGDTIKNIKGLAGDYKGSSSVSGEIKLTPEQYTESQAGMKSWVEDIMGKSAVVGGVAGAGGGETILHGGGSASAEHLPPAGEHKEIPQPVKAIEHAPASVPETEKLPTGYLDLENLDPNANPELVKFAVDHNLEQDEFDYLKGLTERYDLDPTESNFEKILDAGENFSGKKTGVFDHLSRSNVNNPIKALSESRGVVIKLLVQEGKVDGAVRFLQDECGNATPRAFKVLGIDNLQDTGKLRQVLENFANDKSAGHNDASRGVYDYMKHVAYRDMQHLENAKGVIQIKGVGGEHPRIIDVNGRELVGGQMRGYGGGARAETMAEKFEHTVEGTEEAKVVTPTESAVDTMPNAKGRANDFLKISQRENSYPSLTEMKENNILKRYDNEALRQQVGNNELSKVRDLARGTARQYVQIDKALDLAQKAGDNDAIEFLTKQKEIFVKGLPKDIRPAFHQDIVGGERGPIPVTEQNNVFSLESDEPLDFEPFENSEVLIQNTSLEDAVAGTAGGSTAEVVGSTGGVETLVTRSGGLHSSAPSVGETKLMFDKTNPDVVSAYSRAGAMPVETSETSVGTGEVVKPTSAETPASSAEEDVAGLVSEEPGDWSEMSSEARYKSAMDDVQARWDFEVDKMEFSGEMTGDKVKLEVERYLQQREAIQYGFIDQEMNRTQMVDSLAGTMDDGLSDEFKFILFEHVKPETALVFDPDGDGGNMIKFMHQGKEYFVQGAPDDIYKTGDNGDLLMLDDEGDFIPVEWGFNAEGGVEIIPVEDPIDIAA